MPNRAREEVITLSDAERAELDAAARVLAAGESVPASAAASALVSAAITRRVRRNTGKAPARVYAFKPEQGDA